MKPLATGKWVGNLATLTAAAEMTELIEGWVDARWKRASERKKQVEGAVSGVTILNARLGRSEVVRKRWWVVLLDGATEATPAALTSPLT